MEKLHSKLRKLKVVFANEVSEKPNEQKKDHSIKTQIFFNNVTSCVLNNGHASEFFTVDVRRGVRQGFPLSALLFAIGVAVLANAIKYNAKIKRSKVGEKENKNAKRKTQTIRTTVFVRDLTSITELLISTSQ